MKFMTLRINNFLAIGEGMILLNDKGLCLIQGVNNDDSSATSNGVGKSSIPDALCWAIYGETARGVAGDAVVNKVAKKNTYVRVTLRDGDSDYSIERYRKHKEFKNQTRVTCWTKADPATLIDLSKGTERETQEVINQIMGCSLEVFRAAIYAGQEEMPDLPKMTDKQLKLLIEEAAGVARLENAYAAAREKMNAASAKLDTLLTKEKVLEDGLKSMTERIAVEERSYANFEAGREERREKVLKSAEDIKAQMFELFKQIKELDEPKLVAQITELDRQLAEHSDLRKKESELLKALHEADSTHRALSRESGECDKSIKELKVKFDNAEVTNKIPCRTCGKTGDEHDLEEYKKHMASSLEEAIRASGNVAKRFYLSATELSLHQKTYDDFVATIPDVSKVSVARKIITDLLTTIEDRKKKILLLNKDRQAALATASTYETEVNPYDATLKMLNASRCEATKKIFKISEDIIQAQDDLAVYQNVAKVFGPAGVRAHILDTVTPFLNDRTSDYLSALSDGNISAVWSTLTTTAKGDLKEKFNIEVSNSKGAESFAGLSGGEKRKVRLATMLALQDLVASRATKSIELYIADEVDDALDPAGLERLMGVLDRKAKERGTVLVISHNSLTDWIDEVCTVTKKDGLSTIEGALS
jgi:DNA repair exonuclease SbcCD ATPase subunit